ncbi:hypothetical protein THAOC_16912 [Thalassiosira oceanica]|uniref:Enkurin domain-containing protein n=1 Tax=Thalassiosira oceanica TaxID=159749 RepID=K0SW26_THAOC|nr:hypothetical protein THAOC_16912 [Thalassiosira oceanica]|eukprot:EJK62477.1 hypothetical protein THAOC_16912 [Thalassiosira oceanica]
MYRSKYDHRTPLIGSTFCMHGTTAVDGKGFHSLKQNHAVISSFGSRPQAVDPQNFLKKGARQCRTSIPAVEQRNKQVLKPAVPSRKDKPIQGLKASKNYINCNAVEIIHSEPKKCGTTEVYFLAKEDYGKVPAYLAKVKAKIQNEKELVNQFVQEQFLGPDAHQQHQVMDEAERQGLIVMLKQRWGEVNTEYQKYCHKVILDTPGEIKRKASQEAELEALERDIELLSGAGCIHIQR